MMEREQTKADVQRLLERVRCDEAEMILISNLQSSTRFARNAISQNATQQSTSLRLRVVEGGRVGVATINSTDPKRFDEAAARALEAAKAAKPDPELLPMLATQPEYAAVDAFHEETFRATARFRAERILEQVNLCRQRDLEAAGLFTTGGSSCVYANSRGVFGSYRASVADFSFSAFADDGSVEGASDGVENNINSLSTRKIGSAAIDKALKGRKPRTVPPGRYDVVLERGAVSDLALFLNWLGFMSQTHVEGRSALTGKIGAKVFSDRLTVRADPYDPRMEGRPFDMEGFPAQAFTMIERGVVTGLPHDRRTAKALGTTNNGYASQQPDARGPEARNLIFMEGTSSTEDMIRSTKRGLLVNQFHYTNTVDPMAMTITGMTRAGVWMIENGEIAYPVRNLRYTESLIDAFSRLESVGNIAERTGGGLFGGGFLLPTLKIKDFNFSSATEF